MPYPLHSVLSVPLFTHISSRNTDVHCAMGPDIAQIALCDTPSATIPRDFIDTQNALIALHDGCFAQRYALTRLNRLLRLANDTGGRDDSLRAPLWRAYLLAKAIDPRLLDRLSERAWDLLWSMQSVKSLSNRNRTAHLEQLCRDMEKVRTATTVGQRARYLESVFLSGRERDAIAKWEQDHVSGHSRRESPRAEHMEIGAKLHALAGNVDRSRNIMDRLFQLYPAWDTSVMMTVFRAHTSSGLQEHHHLAKKIYDKMKDQKGNSCTIEDYDAWLVGFLEARNLAYSKQVFRDMVKAGCLAASGNTERVKQVLKRLHLLYRLGTDISKMTSIALHAISVLPPVYHGHLFGDWMKLAVVEKTPEAAAQILDMMMKRGYRPETFHFNMLLRALIRTKETPNILKAENIGWRMIDAACKARERRPPPGVQTRSVNKHINVNGVDARTAQGVPTANVTTFALIMHHHAKSLQWEHVEYLVRQLKETSIEPNATIMNVIMDNKCRQGAYSEAWLVYKALTNPQEGSTGVFPNGASFRCLWKTLRLALGDHATRHDPGLPTPRELLKEMSAWWALSGSRYDADRFKMGLAGADSGAIASLIMHCFSYTQDLAGSLVALHVLRHKFSIFPTDKAAHILQRQMAWVDMARESESVRSQYFHSRSNKKNTERVVRVYNILLQQRLDRMNLKEGEYEKLTDEQIGDVGLNLLSEYVRVVLKRSYPPEIVEAMVDAARCAVGLPDLPTGDMDAFEVA
ncbi:uncharacterized protein SETTUDRAFT_177210 [Exserohilum turcica Et28A]|uniref:Pentatricopeptide repeat-containing protein n=1 Tax=Exserohilum turcicum (strain 28A) TaxID=671987 RepID=R0KDR6_EXST2|nr:uncharacterized protein SETTUDRAFT_177210 [Exserohilum turcica Et28A]EOA86302.1 hypothetical protein SETTUDRAFT_177210 [Exserohilum turcica Et28A]